MAINTSIQLRNKVIYSIFVRDFSDEGTFEGVLPKLDAIKKLGTDIIWFLPFYPIGEVNRKGSIGSPYAIQDYRAVDARHGTIEDFKKLVDAIHEKGMKVMIDIVYNHTAPDSWLVANHPEWFYQTSSGERGNKVGDWYDIVDLDYAHKELWAYQIETLVQWANIVDGFRCDVAPLVPLAFWQEARQAVEKVKADFIWLAENVHHSFIKVLRDEGFEAMSDSETYQAFDMTYDYDIHDAYMGYLKQEKPLSYFVERLARQETTYPKNYVKMHCLENHDNPRAAHLIHNPKDLLQWTAFLFFQKGAVLLYNGQETMATHEPSLFEIEKIDWQSGQDISAELAHYAKLSKELIDVESVYQLWADDKTDTVIVSHKKDGRTVLGLFNLKETAGKVFIEGLQDGSYTNVLDNTMIEVENHCVTLTGSPIVVCF